MGKGVLMETVTMTAASAEEEVVRLKGEVRRFKGEVQRLEAQQQSQSGVEQLSPVRVLVEELDALRSSLEVSESRCLTLEGELAKLEMRKAKMAGEMRESMEQRYASEARTRQLESAAQEAADLQEAQQGEGDEPRYY